MRTLHLMFAITCVLALTINCQAQLPGPDLPKLSNMAFGWISMSGSDPTQDYMTSFAPTMLFVREAGYKQAGETGHGLFTFGDLNVSSTFQSAITSLGPGAFRVSRYSYDSSTAELQTMPGMPVQTDGESYELSYAQRIGDTAIGVSLIPKDSTGLSFINNGVTLATGTSISKFGGRIGAVKYLNKSLCIGADYSYQADTSSISYNPLMTHAQDWMTVEDEFITRCATFGVTWEVDPSLQISGAYQRIDATAQISNGRYADQYRFALKKQVNRNLILRASYNNGGQSLTLGYKTPLGILLASYSHNALYSARDVLGTGNAFFVGLDIARK